MSKVKTEDNIYVVNDNNYYKAVYCEYDEHSYISFENRPSYLELHEKDLIDMIEALKTAKDNKIAEVKEKSIKRIAKIKGEKNATT